MTVGDRPYADEAAAVRKLLELANAIEPDHSDGSMAFAFTVSWRWSHNLVECLNGMHRNSGV